MQLHIRHETFYRYGEPVKRSVQNLRLTPRRDPMQRALSWNIATPGRCRSQVDAYGNIVHLLTLDEPHREIRIVVNGVVEIGRCRRKCRCRTKARFRRWHFSPRRR